uniref:N-acetyltransferase domain-containing protein n=3 Tax=Solanum TaxID=4107 RepID=A0A3Q7I8C3_SOLLC
METRSENEPEVDIKAPEIKYVSYGGEHHLPLIMNLVDEELSEPYSIFTYRYFVYLWPQLSFMAFHKGKCVGTVVCKMGEHRGTFRGYIAMLVVLKPYRGKGIATELVTRSIKVMMESGCEEVTLEAEVTNKGALALYGRLGFIRAKRLFRYYLNGVDAFRLKLLFPRVEPQPLNSMADAGDESLEYKEHTHCGEQSPLLPTQHGGESKRVTFWCVNANMDSASSPKESKMIVSVTGATGFVGKRLVQRLHADKHQIRVLTRSRSTAQSIFPVKEFPGIVIAEEPEWKNCIEGSTAVVNLAGTSISTRWSYEVVELINNSKDDARPKVLISATAVGYYGTASVKLSDKSTYIITLGTSETEVFDEKSPSGNDYLAEVCREWEASALKVNKDVRLALIRIGVVLGKDGGALAKMIPLFMMFAGGPLGSGKQWFSWIHLDDLVDLIYEALSNPSYKGVINGTAPNPVRLGEMCEQLGSTLGRPSWLPVPEIALKAVLGEGASVVLDGQKVVPTKAKELGFSFKYRYIKDALKAIMS